jgi:uncharacterized protein (TIGR02646 family)
MKRVIKGSEPQSLADFRAACPSATWEQMRNDALHGGQQAYQDCRTQTTAEQHNLCAYCECKIDLSKPHKCRMEHVHPKSNSSTGKNWNLDWQNLLATCNGGESGANAKPPLPANLSCDAHKRNSVIDVSPLDIPAFPNIFTFDKSTGRLEPNPAACGQATVDASKLKHTMDILNLNCNRLARQRKAVAESIEQQKERLRNKSYSPQKGLSLLAQSYFQTPWPEFFTTIRCCLGQAAETYLHSVNYNG